MQEGDFWVEKLSLFFFSPINPFTGFQDILIGIGSTLPDIQKQI